MIIDQSTYERVMYALRVADELLNKKGIRFDAMDQNPKGVRDLVCSALTSMERRNKQDPAALLDRVATYYERALRTQHRADTLAIPDSVTWRRTDEARIRHLEKADAAAKELRALIQEGE